MVLDGGVGTGSGKRAEVGLRRDDPTRALPHDVLAILIRVEYPSNSFKYVKERKKEGESEKNRMVRSIVSACRPLRRSDLPRLPSTFALPKDPRYLEPTLLKGRA